MLSEVEFEDTCLIAGIWVQVAFHVQACPGHGQFMEVAAKKPDPSFSIWLKFRSALDNRYEEGPVCSLQ